MSRMSKQLKEAWERDPKEGVKKAFEEQCCSWPHGTQKNWVSELVDDVSNRLFSNWNFQFFFRVVHLLHRFGTMEALLDTFRRVPPHKEQ